MILMVCGVRRKRAFHDVRADKEAAPAPGSFRLAEAAHDCIEVCGV